MKRLAVLGQPISHSRSPQMHNAAFAALGLDEEWHYEAIEVSPEEFEARVRTMAAEGFVGANVTIPHKRAALALADSASPAATAIGAANTLSFSGGSVHADNTDAAGLIAALPDSPAGRRALVLGAGGAARAVVWALREAGAEVTIWNRTPARAAALAAEFGVAALAEGESPRPSDYEILVNATSVGLDRSQERDAWRAAGLKSCRLGADLGSERLVVVDLAYGSAETELVQAAEKCGAVTVDGREILVRQGAASFEIWTGLEAPLVAMRRGVGIETDDARSKPPRISPPRTRPGRRA
jgi:shikimate dehydrogenase